MAVDGAYHALCAAIVEGVLLGHDGSPALDQVEQWIEDLRLDMHPLTDTPQLPHVDVEFAVVEAELPAAGPAGAGVSSEDSASPTSSGAGSTTRGSRVVRSPVGFSQPVGSQAGVARPVTVNHPEKKPTSAERVEA